VQKNGRGRVRQGEVPSRLGWSPADNGTRPTTAWQRKTSVPDATLGREQISQHDGCRYGAEEWAWPRSTGRLRRGYPKSTTAHARKLSVPEARLGREQNSMAAGNAGRQHAGGRGARPVRSHLRKLRCTWILGRPASSPDATCRRQPCRG